MNSRKEQQDDSIFRTSLIRSRISKAHEPYAPNTSRYFNTESRQFRNTWEDNAPFSDQAIEYNTHRPYQKNNATGQWRMGYFQ